MWIISIDKNNFLYLQLIDIIKNSIIEVNNFDEVIYNFLQESNLISDKSIMYANKLNSKKLYKNQYVLKNRRFL